MPNFAISFYDFDCQSRGSGPYCESISAGGFDYVLVTNTTQLAIDIDPEVCACGSWLARSPCSLRSTRIRVIGV